MRLNSLIGSLIQTGHMNYNDSRMLEEDEVEVAVQEYSRGSLESVGEREQDIMADGTD